ncbi:MAG: GGDEF domain-containing protein, partial [Comamonas sp.]
KSAGRNRICIEEQPDSTVSAEEKSMLFGSLPMNLHPNEADQSNVIRANPTDAPDAGR